MTVARSGRPAALALLFASAACTANGSRVADTPAVAGSETSVQSAQPAAPAWWTQLGNPMLAALIRQGLDASQEISCQIASLRSFDEEAARDARRIGARIGRFLGDRSTAADPAAREERVERVALRRARLARQIAAAYVDVRRLQQDVAIRNALRNQFRDNAEVAQFRREAGLVPALDGALARSQDEVAQGELGFAQGRLEDAVGELARLVGERPEALVARLGPAAPLADPPVDPLAIAQADDPRRAKLADQILREARLGQARAESRRTVRDARSAYRGGAGSFATLYVAEAAANAVELALLDARAGRIGATLDLWAGQDRDWAREGLAPVVGTHPPATAETITVMAACD